MKHNHYNTYNYATKDYVQDYVQANMETNNMITDYALKRLADDRNTVNKRVERLEKTTSNLKKHNLVLYLLAGIGGGLILNIKDEISAMKKRMDDLDDILEQQRNYNRNNPNP